MSGLRPLIVDSLRHQDPLEAARMAEGVIDPNSQDYRHHLWLGQVLAASNQMNKEAEAHLPQGPGTGEKGK